jgi:hypothetical protein
MPAAMFCASCGWVAEAHGDGPQDDRVHHIEKARPRAAGPGVGGPGFGDDRRHLNADGLKLLRSLQFEQLQLCRITGAGFWNDLVDQLGKGRNQPVEKGHGNDSESGGRIQI